MQRPPNVVCISIDSLRADYCSFLDGDQGTTPELQKFIDERDVSVFSNAISPSIWTLAVHTSLFTGLYPKSHQLNDKGEVLGQHPTFAELLSDNGYETRSFGYNGWLEQGDILRGFEHDSTEIYDYPSWHPWGLTQRIRRKLLFKTFRLGGRDRLTVEAANRWLASGPEPFCCFVHLQSPHYKYHPHIDDYQMFGGLSTLGLARQWHNQVRLYDNKLNRYLEQWHPPDAVLQEIQNQYRGCIHDADRQVGKILETLREEDVLEETIVIVLADHGENFGEDGIFGHNFSFAESLINVPMVVFDPTGTVEAGLRDDVVQTSDIYPTIGEICGFETPETASESLAEPGNRNQAFIHYEAADSMYTALEEEAKDVSTGLTMPEKEMYAVWESPSEKLVWYPGSNRYVSNSDNEAELRDRLERHLNAMEPLSTDGVSKVSPEVEQNLREMGYL